MWADNNAGRIATLHVRAGEVIFIRVDWQLSFLISTGSAFVLSAGTPDHGFPQNQIFLTNGSGISRSYFGGSIGLPT